MISHKRRKTTKRVAVGILAAIMLLMAAGSALASTTTGKGVSPVLVSGVSGDPSLAYVRDNFGPGTDICEYLYSFKIDLGEGAFTEGVPVTYSGGATSKEAGAPDVPFSVTVVKTSNSNFSFYAASQPVFHAWVKGGPNGYMFPYWNPDGSPHFPAGVQDDTGLYSPVPGWSHITFYYCGGREELTVSKTVNTSYTRTHLWDIDKWVTTENGHTEEGYPKIWLYEGGSGDETATWHVDVDYEGYRDGGFVVSGTVTIENTGSKAAVISSVADVLGGVPISVSLPVTLPHTLAPGATIIGTYNYAGYVTGSNVVTVTTAVNTYSDSKAIVWGAPASEVNKTVNISDLSDLFDTQALGSVTAPNGDTFTYTKDFAWTDYGEAGEGHYEYDNIATIVQTGQNDSAKLLVNVRHEDLTVTKTVETSYTRTHKWLIDKWVTTEEGDTENGYPKIWLYEGSAGETATWHVAVDYDGYFDGGYTVSGSVTIQNTGTQNAVISSVFDVLGGAPVSVSLPVTLPYTIAPGESVVGTYSYAGYITGSNVVTVTSTVDTYSDTKAIVWGAPTSEVNKTVNISDSVEGYLGALTAPTGHTFTYSEDFTWAMYAADGHYEYDNTATITQTAQSASAKLLVNVRHEDLTVTKTVETSYTRTHKWLIDKYVTTENGYTVDDDVPKIWLYTDGSGDETATWHVDVDYDGYLDSAHTVWGTVTIVNTGTQDAVISSVTDVLGGTPITVTWPVGTVFPYALPVGQSLVGTYSEVGLFEGANVATVTTTVDTYSDTEPIVWGEPTSETLKTVHIKDISDLFGEVNLGTVTAPNGDTFTYDEYFTYAGYSDKGEHQAYDNTASIVETGQYASALLKVNVQKVSYETAYAKGDEGQFTCFASSFNQWGWTNNIGPGEYTWDLWAGAAQCNTSKGTLVGTVTVRYDPCTYVVTVEYNLLPGFTLKETHVYAGYTQYPQVLKGKKYVATVAPGQYTNNGPFDGRSIWVIVHGVVGVPDPTFGPAD